MAFTSFEFFILLFITLVAYVRAPLRIQNIILLIASYVFYGWWDWRFLSLVIFSSLVDFACGLAMTSERRWPKLTRRHILMISLIVNLGVLGFFKYFNFFIQSFFDTIQFFGLEFSLFETRFLKIILPVGISFYTFQSMSYTIDIYRGEHKPTRNLIDFLLYVSFFPQLVAGPIERASALMPQVTEARTMRWDRFRSGFELMLWGFFKKVVIADNLSRIVESVYNNPQDAGMVWIATYAFAFQIYCDFSGYTDIARGVARMLGFELRLNFNLPYWARNPSEFWQRWHMSLSTWLRDYLYIPLGGNRGTYWQQSRSLAITMLLSGLWHGASWHFVIWGGYHGLLLVGFRSWKKIKKAYQPLKNIYLKRFSTVFSIFIMFHLTCLGWILFRVESMAHFQQIISVFINTPLLDNLSFGLLLTFSVLVFPLVLIQAYQELNILEFWTRWSSPKRLAFSVALIFMSLTLGPPEQAAFIYFQF
ncbi:MBOAT family O-acyltransferase [Magnetococcales bacterium HHB-1]